MLLSVIETWRYGRKYVSTALYFPAVYKRCDQLHTLTNDAVDASDSGIYHKMRYMAGLHITAENAKKNSRAKAETQERRGLYFYAPAIFRTTMRSYDNNELA